MKKLKPPRPPRSVCSSWLRWFLGVVSPSLMMLRSGRPEVMRYLDAVDEYRLATRKMGRLEWRRYRRRKKEEAER